MNNEKINKYLDSHSSVSNLVQQREGVWAFEFASISAYIMTDDRQGIDRMRIMSLIWTWFKSGLHRNKDG